MANLDPLRGAERYEFAASFHADEYARAPGAG